jgi:hypothetical protein
MAITRLPLLLLLAYVCLDIANPLMPGAVQLVHGTIHVVEADRARADGDASIPPLGLLAACLPALPVLAPGPLARSRPAGRARRGRPPHPKRPRARSSLPPPAEDH